MYFELQPGTEGGKEEVHDFSDILDIPLDVRLGLGLGASFSRVAAAHSTLGEVALEAVAAGEGAQAQNAHIRPVIGVCEKLSSHGPQREEGRTYA